MSDSRALSRSILAGIPPFFAVFHIGCSVFGKHEIPEEDVLSDLTIVGWIIAANSISIDSLEAQNHVFAPRMPDGDVDRLDLSGLGLNDSNFYFPATISGLKRIRMLILDDNDFTRLPLGVKDGYWEVVWIRRNKICDPDMETLAFLWGTVNGEARGRDWRSTQRCTTSVSP